MTRFELETLLNYDGDALVAEIRRAVETLPAGPVTRRAFDQVSRVSSSTLVRRLGGWQEALERAGLTLSPLGRRYSDDEYFDNILTVWTHYGRQPKYREMDAPPSAIPAGAYEAKFGGWRRALGAFVERVNADRQVRSSDAGRPLQSQAVPSPPASPKPRTRAISLGLRYHVLRRDRFRCVLCGASPAVTPTCQLHVDHIRAFARGGATDEGNLRTLCSHCNVGKSAKVEDCTV